jgi:hypothetical protein
MTAGFFIPSCTRQVFLKKTHHAIAIMPEKQAFGTTADKGLA